jgi:uncharacterized protein
MKEKLT